MDVLSDEPNWNYFDGSRSAFAEGNFKISGTVATPTFSPDGGTYSSARSVAISTSTSGATIRYTTDGTTPTPSYGTVIASGGTVAVSSSLTLKAIAYKSGWTNSGVKSASYTITGTVATPTFSPDGSTYSSAWLLVVISTSTSGATIRYTTDGTTPTPSYGTVIASGDTVFVGESLTLKAMAYKSGWANSGVKSASYTETGSVATPTFSPDGGTYSSARSVAISTSTSGATIRYTTDGTTPTSSYGTLYSGTVAVSSSLTLKAMAYKSGWTDSGVKSASYTITGTVSISGYVRTSDDTGISEVTVTYGEPETLDQVQQNNDYGYWFEKDLERWQEFRPTTEKLAKLDTLIKRDGNPGNILISIKTQDGTPLWSTSIEESEVSEFTNWISVPIEPSLILISEEVYRIHVKSSETSPDPGNRYYWMGQKNSSYTRGVSDVKSVLPGYDYAFRTYSGDVNRFRQTDGVGYYALAVSSGWSGTVIPSKSGYTFSPTSRSYSNVTANQSNQDYTVNVINAITITPTSGLTTTEGGGTDTFTVELNTQPTADVTIGLSSSDTTEGTVAPASLTFTSANWNTPQTVIVTGVDDATIDGSQAYTVITAAAISSDATYNGIDPSDAAVTNLDNDSAVSSTGDTGDANPGDGICDDGAGNCTLRAAIEEANALSGGHNIQLPAGTYNLTGGALNITEALNIVGSNTTATIIDGGGTDRVFDIASSASGVILQGLTIQNGQTTGNGGGIRNQGTLSLSECTLTDNQAGFNGGSIDNAAGTLTVTNCTLSGNSANNSGGGIYTTGTVNLNNVTLANNGADADSDNNGGGGGIYNDGGTVNLKNTILGGNTDPNSNPDCFGNLNSEGHNLIETLSANCSISGDTTGNVTGQDPLLGPLADNGGPSQTHLLLGGSPARDAGNPAVPGSGGNACAATDQRGVTRPVGPVCDIGAFEGAVSSLPKPELVSPANAQLGLSTTVTFEWKPVTDPDGDAVTYDFYYCTDPDPVNNCGPPIQVSSITTQPGKIYLAGIGYGAGIALLGIFLIGGVRGRKGMMCQVAVVVLTGVLLGSCGGGGGGSSGGGTTGTTPNKTYTVTGLYLGTQYYWAVVAKDNTGARTSSNVWSFTTQ